MRHHTVYFVFLQLIFELSSSTDLRVIPASKVELPCVSIQADFPGASFTWKYNGNLLSPESPSSYVVRENGLFLSIPRVTASTQGEYECVLKLNDMELSQTYNIIVEALLGFTITATAGASVTFPCRFPPHVQTEAPARWYKETLSDKKTKLHPVEVSSGDQRLEWLYPFNNEWSVILHDIVIEDSGIYQCETAEGEKFSTIYLVVEAGPTVTPHSCDGFNTPWESCPDTSSRSAEAVLKQSVTEFSMRLYAELRGLKPSANLLFSPISINQLFYYLLLGARGDTRKSMEAALFVPHGFHCVHSAMKRMREKLTTSVLTASQIYYNPSLNLSDSFTAQSMEFYDSEPVKLLDDSEENLQMINSWVANYTNNKITSLIDDVPSDTQLLMLNAVSFNGQWKTKFEEGAEPQLFTKLNGDLVSVPVLYELKYPAAMENIPEVLAKVVRLPLSNDVSLYILMPRTNTLSSLQMVEEKMTDVAIRHMIKQLSASSLQNVEVTLPRIKLNLETNMIDLIRKLGLSSLFESPNMCGLNSEEKVVLDNARHKAFLALTEEGVEASAATAMFFARSYPSFSALRPFIMLLWSDQADVPLFMGRVTEP
ncbi:plasma protease C1 inhibitor [Genypterus blacodes]|uniref:plasma protease C1 inhibitor n=1 Tax=Genypterus blacodes TaxID=154954 RepID=UPI003F76CD39